MCKSICHKWTRSQNTQTRLIRFEHSTRNGSRRGKQMPCELKLPLSGVHRQVFFHKLANRRLAGSRLAWLLSPTKSEHAHNHGLAFLGMSSAKEIPRYESVPRNAVTRCPLLSLPRASRSIKSAQKKFGKKVKSNSQHLSPPARTAGYNLTRRIRWTGKNRGNLSAEDYRTTSSYVNSIHCQPTLRTERSFSSLDR